MSREPPCTGPWSRGLANVEWDFVLVIVADMQQIADTIMDAIRAEAESGEEILAAEESGVRDYPNPSNGTTRLRMTLPDRQEVAFTLYNVLGQQILAKNLGTLNGGIHDLPFAVPHLSSGTYWLRVQAGRIPLHTAVLLMK